jgi:EmrB/QacA subfamily drug resistance transporter
VTQAEDRRRWLALIVLCSGSLMIVLDTTIVNVALPSIRRDLGFSETSLAWVVNAYLLTFGGFLLLGGRLGDLFGHRRLFLIGIALFTVSSLACGLANSQHLLVAARAVQGLGGAIVSAVALSLIMNMFTESGERAKAMGVFGFVAAGGGTIGVLLGGILTDTLDWHWIFIVNLPVGVAVFAFCLVLLPSGRGSAVAARLDVAGAATVTASLMLAVYAIVNGNQTGWTTGRTLGLLGVAAALLALFLVIEARVPSPLMPLGLFRLRNVAAANVVAILWAAGMFAWFFLSALYLQIVLGYSPLRVGLAFLPTNLIMAAFSLGLSAKLVMRFGIRLPLATGLSLAAIGLVLFARAPVDGTYVVDVLPSMILLAFGAGMSFNPLLLAAMSDVSPTESGLASGVVNTAFMMGGALGLAVLASLAASHTQDLRAAGDGPLVALNGGYHVAFLIGAVFAIAAAAVAATVLRAGVQAPAEDRDEAMGRVAATEGKY